jgi:hypothetical protein
MIMGLTFGAVDFEADGVQGVRAVMLPGALAARLAPARGVSRRAA